MSVAMEAPACPVLVLARIESQNAASSMASSERRITSANVVGVACYRRDTRLAT